VLKGGSMLAKREIEIVGRWKESGIITELTYEENSLLEEQSVNVSCADGRQDHCCHFKHKMNGHQESDVIRNFAGAARWACSYAEFEEERAIYEIDDAIDGMILRMIRIMRKIWHGPCGRMILFGHPFEDILPFVSEVNQLVLQRMNPGLIRNRLFSKNKKLLEKFDMTEWNFQVFDYLHVRKPDVEFVQRQNTYRMNLVGNVDNST
jgi:hypothetical protein